MKLKDALKMYRSKKLLTQEQIAIEIGISLSTLIKAEKGEPVSTLTRAKIINYLGLSMKDVED